MDGKLFYAPIGKTPQRVLDIATGTGIWAIEFGIYQPVLACGICSSLSLADDFPSAEVREISEPLF
jgi:hypothetical protein